MSLPATAYDAIAQLPWFAGLDSAVLERLAAHGRARVLQDGEAVSRRGEPQTTLSIVRSGSLEICIHGRDGKRHVARYLQPGEVYGLIPVLDGGDAVHDADARGPTELLQLPREVLIAELHKQPALALRLLSLMCERSRQLYEVLAFQQLLSLEARVVHLVMSLAQIEPQALPSGAGPIEVHMTQSDLSDMLGVSRQSLSTELKKLERQALIRIAHARLVVIDAARLHSHARALI